MSIPEKIQEYISSQPEQKRAELAELHERILKLMPNCRLWFLDGKDDKGKIVTNPNIGYGFRMVTYANGKSGEFYQIGVSANTMGISIYILGLEDKHALAQKFGKELGRASVTGYCIKFRSLQNINIDVLASAIRYGVEQTSA